jgi:hypothetical protein
MRLIVQIQAVADEFVEIYLGWSIRPPVPASVAARTPVSAITAATSFTSFPGAARAPISARARRTIAAIYLLCLFSHLFLISIRVHFQSSKPNRPFSQKSRR